MYTTRDATYSYVRRRFSLSSSVSVVISEDESELVCFEAWNTDARTCSTRRRFSLSCLRVPVSEDESGLVGIETWNTDARVRRGEKVPPFPTGVSVPVSENESELVGIVRRGTRTRAPNHTHAGDDDRVASYDDDVELARRSICQLATRRAIFGDDKQSRLDVT
jgi:hypothetical protein